MSAETERIRDAEIDVGLHGLVRRVVQIALRIRSVEIDGRRNDAVLQGKDGRDGLASTGSTGYNRSGSRNDTSAIMKIKSPISGSLFIYLRSLEMIVIMFKNTGEDSNFI